MLASKKLILLESWLYKSLTDQAMPRTTSYESIKKQIARLEAKAKAIESARDNKKASAVAKVKALMKKLGVQPADLGAIASKGNGAVKPRKKPAKAKTPVAPKYRDPATGATWTGRGRAPVWLAEKLSQGHTREQYLIAAPASAS